MCSETSAHNSKKGDMHISVRFRRTLKELRILTILVILVINSLTGECKLLAVSPACVQTEYQVEMATDDLIAELLHYERPSQNRTLAGDDEFADEDDFLDENERLKYLAENHLIGSQRSRDYEVYFEEDGAENELDPGVAGDSNDLQTNIGPSNLPGDDQNWELQAANHGEENYEEYDDGFHRLDKGHFLTQDPRIMYEDNADDQLQENSDRDDSTAA